MPQSVVFGASGVVGKAVISLLSASTTQPDEVIAVSRSGNVGGLTELPGVKCSSGNALDKQKTLHLCTGASTIYCCVGLPYDSKVWECDFPQIVESMLHAAEKTGAVLVWADNLYMFGPESSATGMPMKESSREFTSFGRKPSLRARMDTQMLEAADAGRCKVVLVRASDFYGPGVLNSGLGDRVFPPLIKGKQATVFGFPTSRHTYTYVPDFAKALVAVANAGETHWGRAWHVPNAEAIPTTDVMDRIWSLCGHEGSAKYIVLKGHLLNFLSIFKKPLREMPEMSFVWSHDYLVDHSEFASAFPDLGLPTPMEDGLKETIAWYRSHDS